MPLVLSEEQELLQQTARDFVRESAPVAQLRKLRDGDDPVGFSRELWREMVELGWPGIFLPEEIGGAGLGYAELGVVQEELGRTLAASPLFASVLLGGNAVLLAGNESQKKEVLSALVRGERLLALACQESARHDPFAVATRAEPTRDGFRLSGEKRFVLDGHVADQLVVVARLSGGPRDRDGLALFLVDGDARGLERTRTRMVDSRNAARVRFDGVEVDRDRALGQPGRAADVLETLYDRAAIALSAEMLGGAQQVFDKTVAYLKERKQFGVPIGSFQALKHRAAELFCEIELSRSIVLESLRAIDAGSPEVPKLASVCKARLSDAYVRAANEGVQMHGGIGMTDEEDVGLYLKRAKAAALTLGDSTYHRDRYARLEGY
jgi:alkylation response protein AidB-like acyl-CoA dehydrogenase